MLPLPASLILIVRPVTPVRMYGAAQFPMAVAPDVSHRPTYLTLGSETEPSPVAALTGGAAVAPSASTATTMATIDVARTVRFKACSLLVPGPATERGRCRSFSSLRFLSVPSRDDGSSDESGQTARSGASGPGPA